MDKNYDLFATCTQSKYKINATITAIDSDKLKGRPLQANTRTLDIPHFWNGIDVSLEWGYWQLDNSNEKLIIVLKIDVAF